MIDDNIGTVRHRCVICLVAYIILFYENDDDAAADAYTAAHNDVDDNYDSRLIIIFIMSILW